MPRGQSLGPHVPGAEASTGPGGEVGEQQQKQVMFYQWNIFGNNDDDDDGWMDGWMDGSRDYASCSGSSF